MTLKELKEFIFENYYRQNGFSKENSYYSMKHQKKKDFPVFTNKLMKKKKQPNANRDYTFMTSTRKRVGES